MSEGAPIGYIWWALPTRLRAEGVEVAQITALTSLLVLPWVFKFVWAPLIDTLRTRWWTYRSWILSMQFIMGATLAPLFFLDTHSDLSFIVAFLFAHAVAAATQDASIDALAIATVPPSERGRVNAWMQVGMLAGRSLLGGGALIMAVWFGNQIVTALLIAVIYSSSVLLIISKQRLELNADTGKFAERFRSFVKRALVVLTRRSTWVGLLFAGIGGAAFESVGAVAGPFLIDRGFSTENVGVFFAIPSVLAMIVGALAGGYISDRIGKQAAVMLFLVAMVGVVFLLASADWLFGAGVGIWLFVLLTFLYFTIGLFTAGSYALFMDITDPKLGATQFSAFMGATNGCETWSTYTVGRLVATNGYPLTFIVMSCISLLAVPMVRSLKSQQE
jgi:MFS family permease